MRAAVLESIGSSLVIQDLPDPKPGAGDAVLRVLAAPVLGYQKYILNGAMQYPNLFPFVPGIRLLFDNCNE
jgi:alcohol dehydrogenase